MKLERINAAAQTELPNARPLNRNHKVSKISAPIPDRNKIPERIATRALARRFGERARNPCVVCDLLIIVGWFLTTDRHEWTPIHKMRNPNVEIRINEQGSTHRYLLGLRCIRSAFVIRPPRVAARSRVFRHFVGTPIDLPKVVRLL
jgi:hypothetical protein